MGGRLTKKTAGKATSVKRKAPSSIGGTPCRPTLITTKFTPQARMTISADNKSLGDIAVSVSFIQSALGRFGSSEASASDRTQFDTLADDFANALCKLTP